MIQAKGNWIICKEVKSEQKRIQSEIVRPNVGNATLIAVILSVGNGCVMPDGSRRTPDFKVGETIIFEIRGGIPIMVDGEDLIATNESSIMGILKPDLKLEK